MTTKPPTEMPAFVFERRSHVELEAGFILAGQLIVDIPKTRKLNKQQQLMIKGIVQQLKAGAQSGLMPTDAMVYGWHGEARPPNAVDIENDEIMSAWVARSIAIGVRVGSDGMRLDSDALAQMGLLEHDA